MKTSVYTFKYAPLVTVLALALLAFVAQTAMAAGDMGKVTIRVTNNGIVQRTTSHQGGLYRVVVTNETCEGRGVVLKGMDRGRSPYLRFTKVLAPGGLDSGKNLHRPAMLATPADFDRWQAPSGPRDGYLRSTDYN